MVDLISSSGPNGVGTLRALLPLYRRLQHHWNTIIVTSRNQRHELDNTHGATGTPQLTLQKSHLSEPYNKHLQFES